MKYTERFQQEDAEADAEHNEGSLKPDFDYVSSFWSDAKAEA